jgi:hypothetical protein
MMASRWAYEAIAVDHYKNNSYEAPFYTLEKEESTSDYKDAYWLPKILDKISYCQNNYQSTNDSIKYRVTANLALIKNELKDEVNFSKVSKTNLEKSLTLKTFNENVADQLRTELEQLEKIYLERFSKAESLKERLVAHKEATTDFKLGEYKDRYFNESLTDLVRNINTKDKIIEYDNKLLKQSDPIYTDPVNPGHIFDYRTHFFAPTKHFFGMLHDTFIFNIAVIWMMSLLLYIALYYEVFKKIIDFFSK